MEKNEKKLIVCSICKKKKRSDELIPAGLIRQPIAQIIRKQYPDWSDTSAICLEDLNTFRAQYVRESLEDAKGDISSLEEQVMTSLKEQELLSKNVNQEFEQTLTMSDRLSDRMATFAGSWVFIGGFGVVLLVWIIINTAVLILRPFDPFPFILLNLILSCLAAIQAPVILMSQNRQEAKDRLRAEHDYQINLKAELEIRYLHEKIDHLLMNQWQRLLEIQQIQTDIIQEMNRKKR